MCTSSVFASQTDQSQRRRFQIREDLRLALKVINRVLQFFDLLEHRAEIVFPKLVASVPTEALNDGKSFADSAFFLSLGGLQVGSDTFGGGSRLICSGTRGE
jgi:hypothetical protein